MFKLPNYLKGSFYNKLKVDTPYSNSYHLQAAKLMGMDKDFPSLIHNIGSETRLRLYNKQYKEQDKMCSYFSARKQCI
jgi:hypothetical protein